jgi:hypothetical protein
MENQNTLPSPNRHSGKPSA